MATSTRDHATLHLVHFGNQLSGLVALSPTHSSSPGFQPWARFVLHHSASLPGFPDTWVRHPAGSNTRQTYLFLLYGLNAPRITNSHRLILQKFAVTLGSDSLGTRFQVLFTPQVLFTIPTVHPCYRSSVMFRLAKWILVKDFTSPALLRHHIHTTRHRSTTALTLYGHTSQTFNSTTCNAAPGEEIQHGSTKRNRRLLTRIWFSLSAFLATTHGISSPAGT